MKTKLFSFLFALIAGVGMVCASDTEVDGIWYDFDDNAMTATVTYRGSDFYTYNNEYTGDVTIPESVTYNANTYSVTSIRDYAFSNCGSLITVTIPNSVTSIGQQAFDGCSGLTSISVDEGNTAYDSRDNCNAIIETSTNTLIAGCQNTIIPNSVTSIGTWAFSSCSSLTAITIPNSVTSIGDYAFNWCTSLTSVTIGNSVTDVGEYAFSGCSGLTSIIVESSNSMYDSRDNCNAIIETSTNTLILGCQNTIIPNSVTSIGTWAFSSCSSLTSIDIPNSVTSIGDGAFSSCSNLTSITCQTANAPELGSDVFNNVDKSIPLYVPSGSIAAYQAAEGWSEFTNIQAIPGTESSGTTPMFPGDPGTLTLNLELIAAVLDGDELPDYAPTGAGGYPQGSEVNVTAQDIPGYQFVQWSDSVTDRTRTIVIDKSDTLIAYYSRMMIEIAVAAGQWTFICLPPLGDRQYTEEMFTYDGLTGVKWGTYNGATRAAGRSGWETPEAYNALQGYIIYSTTAGTLRINAYEDEIPQSAVSSPLSAYQATHPENANWNFLGNPYNYGFDIAGLAAAGIEAPVTVWNGTAYSTYTPGVDEYIFQPFEAFFIQKAEGGAEAITFSREYLTGNNSTLIEGELPGAFSVSATTQIHFSKGNLQYVGTWQFAENQWDYFGENQYDDHRDLFGWGTGDAPNKVSSDYNDYSTFVDWGVNAISNGGNQANVWRTLTNDEWGYLFQTRTNASSLYGLGVVNGINGMIVLPDDWSESGSLSFNAGALIFESNSYTIEEWATMERAGAVFLPSAGYRWNADFNDIGTDGRYWSATENETSATHNLYFGSSGFNPQSNNQRFLSLSVRLVR